MPIRGHSAYPYLDHLNAKARYEFLSESGDVDAEAALGVALEECGANPKAMLDQLHGEQWVLVRPWDITEEKTDHKLSNIGSRPFDDLRRGVPIRVSYRNSTKQPKIDDSVEVCHDTEDVRVRAVVVFVEDDEDVTTTLKREETD